MANEVDNKQEALLAKITASLDQHVTDIDPIICQRLAVVRKAALQKLHKPRRSVPPVIMMAMAASVIAVVIGVLLWQPTAPGTIPALEDIPILSAGEDFELLEDLDFYRWLEVEKHTA